MEFIDEEYRPRFVLHSRSSAATSTAEAAGAAANKLHAAACIAGSAILFFGAFYFSDQSQILFALLVWISISLLIGPFAPAFITGGDIRVGIGEILEPLDETEETPKKRGGGPRIKPRRSEDPAAEFFPPLEKDREKINGISAREKESRSVDVIESEWNEQDFEILKKQIAKHPVGAPGRWEQIAKAFNGRHGVESVIKEAKSLSEKKPNDSFSEFLRQRKNQDKRSDAMNPDFPEAIPDFNAADLGGVGNVIWGHVEDLALLNALKAFPKDVPLRWEKIAAAVPGKSKADCMKRISELKKDFRNSKAS